MRRDDDGLITVNPARKGKTAYHEDADQSS